MSTIKEKVKRMSLKLLIRNIYHLFTDDNKKIIEDYKNSLSTQKIINKMLLSFIKDNNLQYENELLYFIENGKAMFPYKRLKTIEDVKSGFDGNLGLPFVYHKDKKLYFSKDYSIDKSIACYTNYICVESLLDEGFIEKTPHKYQSDTFQIEDGDILVDVGCAEALLALDVIDKVSHVYLIEGDSKWIPALNATFAPYKDKVTIINKFVTDTDGEGTIKLSTVLKNDLGKKMFVKMDIEGYELSVLKGSVDVFANNSNIKCACCTYHRNGDEIAIKEYFENLLYETEYSDGVVFVDLFDEPEYPFFRKGLLRTWK